MRFVKIRRWGSSFMARLTTRRAKRIALITLGSLVGLLVLVQLVYPRDRALPGTELAEHSIAGWTTDDIARLASELYGRSTVEVAGSDKTMLARNLSAVGVVIDFDAVAAEASAYPWWLRLVPTSLFWHGAPVGAVEATIDQGRLDAFVAESESSFVISPENAKLAVEGSEVVIVDEVKGARLSADEFKAGVSSARYFIGSPTLLDVRFAYTDPAIRAVDLGSLRDHVNGLIDRTLTLTFESTSVQADRAALASWLTFEQTEATSPQEIVVGTNDQIVSQFVHSAFDKVVAKPAGVTNVYLTDGIEQSRTPGAEGRAIDDAAMNIRLRQVVTEQRDVTSVDVMPRAVAPSIKKHHTFTKSQRGLQAYVNSLADEGDIRVSVAQLGGSRWSASYRGAEQTVAASTYKVFVVAYALNKIAEGELSYDDSIGGTTLRECMSRTIVKSDNACPEAMLKEFGRGTVNSFMYERGYSRATNLNHATASQSSTNDLIKAMTEIENGTLLKGAERSFMIGLMREQVYRQGIPAGTSATSAGKVGFLWGYLNDAAIVYHPGGTYVLSIMTNNASWSKIAEITRKIEGIMY